MQKEIVNRCAWVNLKNPLSIAYHDTEWGVPQHTDEKLFEMLLLECFQAGLSWECILNKRENFRQAFDGFDVKKSAGMMGKNADSCCLIQTSCETGRKFRHVSSTAVYLYRFKKNIIPLIPIFGIIPMEK